MTWRFRRSIRLAPGFRLNLGKRSASLSIGGRGAHVTVGRRGTRATVGLPGTGLSYSETIGAAHRPAAPRPSTTTLPAASAAAADLPPWWAMLFGLAVVAGIVWLIVQIL
jgi:hypothetical protein